MVIPNLPRRHLRGSPAAPNIYKKTLLPAWITQTTSIFLIIFCEPLLPNFNPNAFNSAFLIQHFGKTQGPKNSQLKEKQGFGIFYKFVAPKASLDYIIWLYILLEF